MKLKKKKNYRGESLANLHSSYPGYESRNHEKTQSFVFRIRSYLTESDKPFGWEFQLESTPTYIEMGPIGSLLVQQEKIILPPPHTSRLAVFGPPSG